MQFQIEKLILWPKNQKYSYKAIGFQTNAINVITGDSRTGKSAIIPIIDYCLASGECYIPTQTIRNACSWFGVIVQLDRNKLLLARREPGIQKSTNDMMFIQGDDIEIPQFPEKNSNCQAVKSFLDEYARLSFLETEDSLYGSRPAFRDLMAFCFQPQNVVANANILFYKTDKTEHRNKLISIFPYILGAITSEVLSARQELTDLQRTLKKKEKEYEKLCELTVKWESEIKGWVSVAIELGLLKEKSRNMKFEEQLVALQELVKENTEEKVIRGEGILKSSEEMVMLREEENRLAMELTKYKNRYTEMSQLIKSIADYREALTIQVERLNITEWLIEKSSQERVCPVCQQVCVDDTKRNMYLSRLQESKRKKRQIEEVPAAFEREYEMSKGRIQKLTDELQAVQKRIKIEENRIEHQEKESQGDVNRYTLDGISRFLGKIEYASEAIAYLETDGALIAEITKIRDGIDSLRAIVDEAAIRRKIESAITKISINQMELLKSMDSERPHDPFRLDYKNLTIEIDGEEGRKDYLWEIGSGSNWLAYHISTVLGLQEFFSTFRSSVPNFVVFDQPSQVYFPHQSTGKNEMYKLEDVDSEAVKRIFTTMAKCISNMDNKMQIIVLEHADSSIYGDVPDINEVCIWRNGEKLIPKEWID